MSGVAKLEISESVKELKTWLKQQKFALNPGKVQALYLLKIRATGTVRYLVVMMGRSEATMHYWLRLYQRGLDKLLEEHPIKAQCLEIYLDKFAQPYNSEIHLIQMDKAPSHRAQSLKIPETVVLFFQPPYCPEVNPMERVWQALKKSLQNKYRDCGRQFVENPSKKMITQSTKDLIDKLLLEKIPRFRDCQSNRGFRTLAMLMPNMKQY